jgi:hypothetical protein
MKLFALLSFLLPIAVASQTKADYQNAMKKFQKFYNGGHGDSINAMFGHGWDQMKAIKPLWTNEDIASNSKEFGTLNSFKFIGIDTLDPNRVHVFETFFSNGDVKTTSLTLGNDFGLDTFRFITSSEGINELLKKQKRRR